VVSQGNPVTVLARWNSTRGVIGLACSGQRYGCRHGDRGASAVEPAAALTDPEQAPAGAGRGGWQNENAGLAPNILHSVRCTSNSG